MATEHDIFVDRRDNVWLSGSRTTQILKFTAKGLLMQIGRCGENKGSNDTASVGDQIVAAHGGTIDVRSNAEDGTIFTVRLPR